ncbi:hypothetical protein AO284_21935 [Pseudomonas sp. NZIPFR-PS2]|nr:hypothetical protein AO284_21935 [Pseudomonas sp. NZIPFR-PS2]
MATNTTARARPGSRAELEIDETLSSLSRKLSNKEHVFISAISTQDVTSLLLRRYAAFSEEINAFQANVSRHVIDKIRQYEKTQSERHEADALLSETRAEIEKIEEFRSETMKPLDAIRMLVEKLFQHTGIDEPELSLHVDWQRQLYPILQSQESGNQFIFATHSPFIYGKYPDKEVSIGNDKGE